MSGNASISCRAELRNYGPSQVVYPSEFYLNKKRKVEKVEKKLFQLVQFKKATKGTVVIETRKLNEENWDMVDNASVDKGYNFILDRVTSVMNTVAPNKIKQGEPL